MIFELSLFTAGVIQTLKVSRAKSSTVLKLASSQCGHYVCFHGGVSVDLFPIHIAHKQIAIRPKEVVFYGGRCVFVGGGPLAPWAAFRVWKKTRR